MTLAEIVALLPLLPMDDFICARRPFSSQSEAIVLKPTEDWDVPGFALEAGFDYFLGVSTANEVAAEFKTNVPPPPEMLEILIFYIEHDGYPPWAFQRWPQ